MEPEKIKELCSLWRESVINPDGGYVINRETEKYRLHRNSCIFHELSFDSLCVAIAELSKSSILKSEAGCHDTQPFNMSIDLDHMLLWGWCAQMVLLLDYGYFDEGDDELRMMMVAVTNAVINSNFRSPSNFALNYEPFLHAMYISFPLLEGCMKKNLSHLVSSDGEVEQDFEVNRKEYKIGNCIYLDVFLFKWVDTLVEGVLKSSVLEILNHIKKITGETSGVLTIKAWRNSISHGGLSHNQVFGVVFGIVLLAQLSKIQERFLEVSERCKALAEHTIESRVRGVHVYYPYDIRPLI